VTAEAAHDGVLRFLDALRAAEAAGAQVLEAWIAVCSLDGLRGGLRAIAEREAVHAELLAARLCELGTAPAAELSEAVRAAALACFGSAAVSDEEKIALVLARYPDDSAATRPIAGMIRELSDDPETCELLRLIGDGEAATVAWLRAYHDGLARRGRSVPGLSLPP
jgi:hypothetical protein